MTTKVIPVWGLYLISHVWWGLSTGGNMDASSFMWTLEIVQPTVFWWFFLQLEVAPFHTYADPYSAEDWGKLSIGLQWFLSMKIPSVWYSVPQNLSPWSLWIVISVSSVQWKLPELSLGSFPLCCSVEITSRQLAKTIAALTSLIFLLLGITICLF